MKPFVAIVTIVVMACGAQAATSADDPTDCILIGSRVDPTSIVLHVGDSTRFTLLAAPACPSVNQLGQPVLAFWSSSDSLVARVNSNDGLTRALVPGRVTITAADRRDPNVKSAAVLSVVP